MNKKLITVILIAYNEEIHIRRFINNLKNYVDRIIVVDSYSSDLTVSILNDLNVEVIQNRFVSHSDQLNWAITNIKIDTYWVMKLDADEYILSNAESFRSLLLNAMDSDISGISLRLRRNYRGKLLRFGGVGKINLLRIWRNGCARVEDKLMDEHVLVSGRILKSNLEFVDHSLISYSDWILKHDKYSTLEATEYLQKAANIHLTESSSAEFKMNSFARYKRIIKNNFYYKLPSTLRAILYFLYRYVVLLGWLDGKRGFEFALLQGFWYRYLVDLKISEMNRKLKGARNE